jgi:hypothetical protein
MFLLHITPKANHGNAVFVVHWYGSAPWWQLSQPESSISEPQVRTDPGPKAPTGGTGHERVAAGTAEKGVRLHRQSTMDKYFILIKVIKMLLVKKYLRIRRQLEVPGMNARLPVLLETVSACIFSRLWTSTSFLIQVLVRHLISYDDDPSSSSLWVHFLSLFY